MELTIGDFEYQTRKLNAIQQFHVARRLAPAIAALGSSATEAFKLLDSIQPENGEKASLEDIPGTELMRLLGPLAKALAEMDNADTEYILNTCLGVCFRKQPGGWAKVQSNPGSLMFDDIDMGAMMQLTIAVIRENLANFIPALPESAS